MILPIVPSVGSRSLSMYALRQRATEASEGEGAGGAQGPWEPGFTCEGHSLELRLADLLTLQPSATTPFGVRVRSERAATRLGCPSPPAS